MAIGRWGARWGAGAFRWGQGIGAPAAAVVAPSPAKIPDDGGVIVTLTGSFSALLTYTITVGGLVCYSGVSGQGASCRVGTDGTLKFVSPGGVAVGAQSILVAWEGGSQTMTDALTVVRRPRRQIAYEMARLFPAGAYGAGRGPVDPASTEVLG